MLVIRCAEHVGINVQNMDESIKFYTEILGLQLRRRAFLNEEVELAFLHFQSQPDFEIELICGKNVETGQGKVDHLAFRVESIVEAIRHLKEKGISFKTEGARLVLRDVKIIFFNGPDGEVLELVER